MTEPVTDPNRLPAAPASGGSSTPSGRPWRAYSRGLDLRAWRHRLCAPG